ncbi:MAG: hypothetical protein OEU91_01460 [Gammaproteobacteria bacterium]|nr:hypothetical protein [Gammaproteobacteria bacterium]
MVFEISDARGDPRRLTQAVTQITTFLDLYHAELARILGVKCTDIGQLTSGRHCLEPGTPAWQQACLFVRFYQVLFARMAGNGVAMRHWLRVSSRELDGIPHLLIVDEGRLADIVAHLERIE